MQIICFNLRNNFYIYNVFINKIVDKVNVIKY